MGVATPAEAATAPKSAAQARLVLLVGLLLAATAAGVVGLPEIARWWIGRTPFVPELPPRVFFRAEMLRKYGPKLYSFHEEETLIRAFFEDSRDGTFVDVGCGPYDRLSNTYYLEKNLGWHGVAVDAQARYAADYKAYRPKSDFITTLVVEPAQSGRTVDFWVDLDNEYGSSIQEIDVSAHKQKVTLPATTLDEILARKGVGSIDFLSMDIEDSEPGALAGFSIQRYRPRLVCIEMHDVVKREIVGYFDDHGYVRLESYADIDGLNGYFVPAGSADAERDAKRVREWMATSEPYRKHLETALRQKMR